MQVKEDKVKELERRIVLTKVDHTKHRVFEGVAGSGYEQEFLEGQIDGLAQALSIFGGVPGVERRDLSRLFSIADRVARWEFRWTFKNGYDPNFSGLDPHMARVGIRYLEHGDLDKAMTEVYREDLNSGG